MTGSDIGEVRGGDMGISAAAGVGEGGAQPLNGDPLPGDAATMRTGEVDSCWMVVVSRSFARAFCVDVSERFAGRRTSCATRSKARKLARREPGGGGVENGWILGAPMLRGWEAAGTGRSMGIGTAEDA